jgi:hypothetical protein
VLVRLVRFVSLPGLRVILCTNVWQAGHNETSRGGCGGPICDLATDWSSAVRVTSSVEALPRLCVVRSETQWLEARPRGCKSMRQSMTIVFNSSLFTKEVKNDDPTSQSMLDVEVGSGCTCIQNSRFKTPNSLTYDK